MRLLLMIIVAVFLVTFAWGWVIHVHNGQMDIKSYTEFYWREVNDQFHYLVQEAEKAIDTVKKPMPARKEFEL